MSILEELLGSKCESEDEKVKKICDEITLEEKERFSIFRPLGANIFLALKCSPYHPSHESFLCLEREEVGKFIVSLRSRKKDSIAETNQPRLKVWEINESKPEKILKFYAEKLNLIEGK